MVVSLGSQDASGTAALANLPTAFFRKYTANAPLPHYKGTLTPAPNLLTNEQYARANGTTNHSAQDKCPVIVYS
jgi:hypothetical protein